MSYAEQMVRMLSTTTLKNLVHTARARWPVDMPADDKAMIDRIDAELLRRNAH